MAPGSSKHHELRMQSAAGGGNGVNLQQLLVAAVALVLIPFTLFAFYNLNSQPGARTLPAASPRDVFSAQLVPTYENVDGTEYVWQIPTDRKVRGVLFLAHGCHGRATFFWDEHPQCQNCAGLPEERTLVLHALSRGYAVIAVSSTGVCWSVQLDAKKVLRVLGRWISEKKLDGVPVVAMGASSGGSFLSILPLHFKFQSIVIEIAPGKFDSMDFDSTYPPTLFVHMPKDRRLAARVTEAMGLLRSKGVSTGEVRCLQVPVTPHFFSERIPEISDRESEIIVATLEENGLLNRDGYMKLDGRQSEWAFSVMKGNILPLEISTKYHHHLEEEMNVAYAYHELTSLPAQAIFDWFEAHDDTSSGVGTS